MMRKAVNPDVNMVSAPVIWQRNGGLTMSTTTQGKTGVPLMPTSN